MRRVLGWVAVFILVVGGATVTFWPVPTWRLYDANWQPLAMTQAEAYCVGQILAGNGYNNIKDDREVDGCVAGSKLDNAIPDVGRVAYWGCDGIRSIDSSWSQTDCLATFIDLDIWFLQHGGYTWAWNDQNPRPNVAYSNIREAPRGERNDNNRQTEGRFQ